MSAPDDDDRPPTPSGQGDDGRPPAPSGPDGRRTVHRHTVYHHTVRYLECDQQGVVFNMWYLGWFDEALAAFVADGGLPYPDMLAAGYDVQLVHSDIDWVAPLRWGDAVAITVDLRRIGTTSFTLGFDVATGGRSTAAGRTVYVAVRTDGSGKVAVPAILARALGAPRPAG